MRVQHLLVSIALMGLLARATGASDGGARLFDAATGELLAVLRGHDGAVNSVLFTDDGRVLTGGDDGAIQVWVTSREELVRLATERLGC